LKIRGPGKGLPVGITIDDHYFVTGLRDLAQLLSQRRFTGAGQSGELNDHRKVWDKIHDRRRLRKCGNIICLK